MSDQFEIPVVYKGENLLFNGMLISTGFTYKIQVDINEFLINFERDDENNFRAVLHQSQLLQADKIDKALVKEIGETLQQLFAD